MALQRFRSLQAIVAIREVLGWNPSEANHGRDGCMHVSRGDTADTTSRLLRHKMAAAVEGHIETDKLQEILLLYKHSNYSVI